MLINEQKEKILRSLEKTELFLACDERSCFAYDKALEKLIKEIEK